MTHDEFESPMKARFRAPGGVRALLRRVDPALALAIVSGAAVAFGAAWALFVTDPFGGEPMATAVIERRLPPRSEQAAHRPPETPAPPATGHAARDGVPVVKPGDPMPKSGPVIIRIPGDEGGAPSGHAAAGARPAAPEKALLEDSRYGPLPRIGDDGRRPLDVYARPTPKPQPGIARVALVVSGLGVSRDATEGAIAALPPDVTLAFSPYASDVADLVARARAEGREALIQAPMEPFDYPANDPGPQTLLTTLPASANLDRLRWALGRASGYVGVAPLTGGRFLEDADALQPIFVELARRGLMFVGGSANGDRAVPTAERASLPLAPTVVGVDATPDAASIDAALARLEAEAKKGGMVIGVATPSPLTLKRIGVWQADLRKRGVALVPASAAVGAQGPS